MLIETIKYIDERFYRAVFLFLFLFYFIVFYLFILFYSIFCVGGFSGACYSDYRQVSNIRRTLVGN